MLNKDYKFAQELIMDGYNPFGISDGSFVVSLDDGLHAVLFNPVCDNNFDVFLINIYSGEEECIGQVFNYNDRYLQGLIDEIRFDL